MHNQIRVLLIEDNPGDAKLVQIYLSESYDIAFQLTHVTHLSEALYLAQQNDANFDVALLDMHLPDSSGSTTLERALAGFPNSISIIVLSGIDDEAAGLQAVQAGAQDYLVKGQIDTPTLIRTILHSIQRRNMQLKVEQVAQELRLSERRLLQAQSIAKIGNYELKQNTNNMYWSAEVFRILGYQPEAQQPLTQHYYQLINPDERTAVRQLVADIFEGQYPNGFEIEHKICTPAGETKYLFVQGRLDYDETLATPHIVGTVQDVSVGKIQQEKLKQSEERHRTIFEQSQDAIYICTTSGRLIEYNHSLIALLGYNSEELESLPIDHFYAQADKYFAAMRLIEAQESIKDHELQLRHKDGHIIDALMTATLWRTLDGDIKGYHAMVRDNSHYKQNQELVKAKEIAERSAALKEQFLANMSHEIRTPMNIVVGMAHLLEGTPLNQQQQEYLSNLKLSSETLLKIINNILDLSKIESGKLTLEKHPFKVQELIGEVVQAYKFKAREKGISLFVQTDINLPDTIIGDSVRLLQILNNLVSNAVKYTHKGEITLRTQVVTEDDQTVSVRFMVKDTGIGILPDKQKSVFDSFSQASTDTTRLYGGTGLGLSIAKHLVELFGGELQLRSTIGEGSEFSFAIQLHKLASTAAPANFKPTHLPDDMITVFTGQEIPEQNQKWTQPIDQLLHILLVEDHKLNQVVVVDIIKRWSPKLLIDIAENGQEAIDKLQQQPQRYDLILMDISMPIMDGYQATEYIRQQMPEPVKSLPIIAMTAHAFNINANKCFEVGMNAFVSKPINPTVMFANLNEILHRFGKLPHPADAEQQHAPNNDSQHTTTQPTKLTELDYLDELAGGDPELKAMMLETVVDGLPTEVSTLEHAYHQRQWSEVRAAAHKLKSTCAYVGLASSVELARSIENSAYEQKNLDAMGKWVKELVHNCQLAQHELVAELSRLKVAEHIEQS